MENSQEPFQPAKAIPVAVNCLLKVSSSKKIQVLQRFPVSQIIVARYERLLPLRQFEVVQDSIFCLFHIILYAVYRKDMQGRCIFLEIL